jgi:hypothetical protein
MSTLLLLLGGKKRRKHKMKAKKCKAHRSKKTLTYHGRSGHPLIHTCIKGKKYIMVRKKGGGTKRVFLDKNGNVPKKLREKQGGKKK